MVTKQTQVLKYIYSRKEPVKVQEIKNHFKWERPHTHDIMYHLRRRKLINITKQGGLSYVQIKPHRKLTVTKILKQNYGEDYAKED